MRTVHLKVRDIKPGSFETARITCSTLSRRVDRVQDAETVYIVFVRASEDNCLSGVVALFFRVVRDWFRTWGYHLCHGLDMIHT